MRSSDLDLAGARTLCNPDAIGEALLLVGKVCDPVRLIVEDVPILLAEAHFSVVLIIVLHSQSLLRLLGELTLPPAEAGKINENG